MEEPEHREVSDTVLALLRKPSAYAPLGMSLAAFTLIGAALLGWVPTQPAGTVERADEGAAARLFQLLLLLQLPIAAIFAGKWLPRAPRPATFVLVLQAGAVLLAIATIVWLEW